jgi:hypothetical protein
LKDEELAKSEEALITATEQMADTKAECELAVENEKLQVEVVEQEKAEIKADVVQLAQIVQNLTKINNEMNEKVVEMNTTLETTNT